MNASTFAAALSLVLAACAAQGDRGGHTAEKPLLIAPEVWSGYESYAKLRRPGAFAVSADGNAYGYSYCPDDRCWNEMSESRNLALSSCTQAGGRNCLIFAFGGDIRVPYKVR